MCVRVTMSDGRSDSALARSIARSMASRSFTSAMCCTCQPYASKRSAASSLHEMSVPPSIVMWLLSKNPMSLPSFWWPANEAASCEMPSIRSPSLAMNQV